LAWTPSARPALTYLNGGDWSIVAEFTEVGSGKRSARPVNSPVDFLSPQRIATGGIRGPERSKTLFR
jgi:hypothetical protein